MVKRSKRSPTCAWLFGTKIPETAYGSACAGNAVSERLASTIARGQLLRPYPQFVDVFGAFAFLGDSIYHAFTLKVEKRFSRGFSALISYTGSKLIDASAGSGGSIRGATGTSSASTPSSPILNWYDRTRERSKGVEDIPRRLVVTGLYQLPFAKNTTGWRKQALDGWQLNAIATMQSGPVIAPIAGNVTFMGAGAANLGNRPNVVAGCNPNGVNQSLTQWFNTACFTVPAPFTYGNFSRTIANVAGPGLQTIDLSLIKDISVKERLKLQLRAEAYNLLNRANFYLPGRDATAQDFGVVSSTIVNSSRELQFSLKLVF